MRVVLQVFSKPPKILLARGYRLNKREQNVNLFMKKVIPRSVRLSWSAEKSNVEQTILKFGKSRLKYASCTSSR